MVSSCSDNVSADSVIGFSVADSVIGHYMVTISISMAISSLATR